MGFFSRRSDDGLDVAFRSAGDRSMVQAIRSRIYGKTRTRDRPPLSQTLPPAVSDSPQAPRRASRPPSMKSMKPYDKDNTVRKHTVRDSHSQPNRLSAIDTSKIDSSSKAQTDAITITLAQRLNELATANSEGLLNDDEYRLLRQNIFERLASGSTVPSEPSVVPTASPHPKPSPSTPDLKRLSHGQRTPSVRSKNSISSAMSGVFKRASLRRKGNASHDTSSVYSMGSNASFQRPGMSCELRNGSTSRPHTPNTLNGDRESLSSRLFPSNSSDHLGSSAYRTFSRSMRKLSTSTSTPPSSFPGRIPDPVPHVRSPSTISGEPLDEDDEYRSVAEIRKEMETMEAEGLRLLDAFNGLELSTLTRNQGGASQNGPNVPRSPSTLGVHRKPMDGRSTPGHGSDADMRSVHSGSSLTTSHSRAGSHRTVPSQRLGVVNGMHPSSSTSSTRKRSMSSLSSRNRGLHPSASTPSALPSSPLRNMDSVSSINLKVSPTSVVEEEEQEVYSALEAELGEIRRRKAEVTQRYQSRLDYLRAQLRGAELREKLLRK